MNKYNCWYATKITKSCLSILTNQVSFQELASELAENKFLFKNAILVPSGNCIMDIASHYTYLFMHKVTLAKKWDVYLFKKLNL